MTWTTGVSPIYHLWPLGHHLVLLVLFCTLLDPRPCVLSNFKRRHDSIFCGVPQEFGTSLTNSLSESKSWFTKSRIVCDFYQCLIWEIFLAVIGFSSLLPLVDLLWSNYWVLSPLSDFLMFFKCYLFFYFLRFNWGITIFSWLLWLWFTLLFTLTYMCAHYLSVIFPHAVCPFRHFIYYFHTDLPIYQRTCLGSLSLCLAIGSVIWLAFLLYLP